MPTGDSEAGAVPEPAPAPSRRPVAGSDLLPGGSRAFPTEPSDLGVRANVNVTVGLDTLLGLNEEPGELEGHGPISAVMARALAFGEGSTWRRMVTDPVTGQLLDYGRTKYKAPAPLDEFARARDVLCRTVNCDHPARLCDLDHTERFPDGPTSAWNLHSHCRRHHRLKHEGGWHHEVLNDPAFPPGTLKITSPTGHVYYSHAPAIRPINDGLEQDSDGSGPEGPDGTRPDDGRTQTDQGEPTETDAGNGTGAGTTAGSARRPRPAPPRDSGPPPF